jgi:AraC-like DNA-binding protein
LETTGNSITQIALKVGVPDCAHFSRIFRREVGVTPRAYRDGKRKNPNYRVPTD